MTNIYLTDPDKVAIVDFVKDHKELYEKTNGHFNDEARMSLGEIRQQSQAVCQGAHTVNVWKAPKEMMEHQNWIHDKFVFLSLTQGAEQVIRIQFPAQGTSASAASAHNISRVSTDTISMDISI